MLKKHLVSCHFELVNRQFQNLALRHVILNSPEN